MSITPRIQGIQALHVGGKPWFDGLPICPALNQHHIIHAGIRETAAPIKVAQFDSATTCFVATIEGKGHVVGGEHRHSCKPGIGCLLPGNTDFTFEPQAGSRWKFCWVAYTGSVDQRGNSKPSALVEAFEALPLQSAILGLVYECTGRGQPNLIQEWADLMHAYVSRFSKTKEQAEMLNPLWDRLVNQLAAHWTLKRLANEAGYSSEHLRRLCRATFGRSPMQQLSYLRLRRAADMLVATDHTIEAIARDVGYQNPFVFSNAFNKWMGWRPSEYRKKRLTPSDNTLRAA